MKTSKTGRKIYLGIFVDDILCVYAKEDEAEWMKLKSKLATKYKLKELGDALWVLGMKIDRDRKARTIKLTQESYVDKMLLDFRMTDCHIAPTPECTSISLSLLDCPSTDKDINEMQSIPYRSLVGKLMYLCISKLFIVE